MSTEKRATHEDANLILRLYELRREERMRDARNWFAFKFFPQSLNDIQEISSSRGDDNAFFRMVTSYWDMAASFVVHGSLDANLFMQSAGEMLMVYGKMEPFLAQMRELAGLPDYLQNVEKAIQMVDWAPERVRWLQKRFAQFKADSNK